MTRKRELRKEALLRRKALPPEERREKSKAIIKHLIQSPFFKQAQRILFYASFDHEVETWEGIRVALAQGKEVYLPRTNTKEKSLSLHRLLDLKELAPGAYGILEPPAQNPKIAPEDLDLIVCPGVAFDLRGGRLGYGGGYYDRLLIRAKRAKQIALAFECQIFKALPLEAHDIRMEVIITEKGLKEIF